MGGHKEIRGAERGPKGMGEGLSPKWPRGGDRLSAQGWLGSQSGCVGINKASGWMTGVGEKLVQCKHWSTPSRASSPSHPLNRACPRSLQDPLQPLLGSKHTDRSPEVLGKIFPWQLSK